MHRQCCCLVCACAPAVCAFATLQQPGNICHEYWHAMEEQTSCSGVMWPSVWLPDINLTHNVIQTTHNVLQIRELACRWGWQDQVCVRACRLWQDCDCEQCCESATDPASTGSERCWPWMAVCESGRTIHPHSPTVLQAAVSGTGFSLSRQHQMTSMMHLQASHDVQNSQCNNVISLQDDFWCKVSC